MAFTVLDIIVIIIVSLLLLLIPTFAEESGGWMGYQENMANWLGIPLNGYYMPNFLQKLKVF